MIPPPAIHLTLPAILALILGAGGTVLRWAVRLMSYFDRRSQRMTW